MKSRRRFLRFTVLSTAFLSGFLPVGKACKMAVERSISKHKDVCDLQVGFIALNKQGESGSYCIHKGFSYAVRQQSGKQLIEAKSKR